MLTTQTVTKWFCGLEFHKHSSQVISNKLLGSCAFVAVPAAVPSAVENKTEVGRETFPCVTAILRLATPTDSCTRYTAWVNSTTTPTGGISSEEEEVMNQKQS